MKKMVGKYSPRSRRARIERFLRKRKERVWTKRVKYDVRVRILQILDSESRDVS